MTDPAPEDPPARPIRTGPLVGGLVLGVVVCWVWIAVVSFAGVMVSYDNSPSSLATVAIVAFASLPVAVGVLLVLFEQTRHAGAGLLMGLAIGMIVGAGICGSLFVPSLVP